MEETEDVPLEEAIGNPETVLLQISTVMKSNSERLLGKSRINLNIAEKIVDNSYNIDCWGLIIRIWDLKS